MRELDDGGLEQEQRKWGTTEIRCLVCPDGAYVHSDDLLDWLCRCGMPPDLVALFRLWLANANVRPLPQEWVGQVVPDQKKSRKRLRFHRK